MIHRIAKVEVLRHPVLNVSFEDGVSGEFDMTGDIHSKPIFAELKDESFFRSVAIGRFGDCVGWRLNDIGQEIDLSADGLRIHVETDIVRRAARDYRAKMQAAE